MAANESPLQLSIKILLWNVWNLPSILTDGASKSRAAAISSKLNDYDIVVLNEAFVNKNKLLSSAEHKWKYMPARPWLRLVNSGLLFLSKYEILEESWEGYRKAAWQDEFAAKGIGVVTVEISENGVNYGKIRVFGTHMQAGNTKSEQVARKSQAEQVAAFIGQKEDDKIPLVFAGDLNMGPRQDPECNEFSVHYSNHTDAVARCSTYEHMVSGSQLEEVPSTVPSEYGSDICRFLVNGIDPAKCELTYEGLRGEDGRDLSDTKPMCLTIKLDPL